MPGKKGPPKRTLEWPADREPFFTQEVKWREFADEFIKDFHATDAYKRCSWTRVTKATSAHQSAARLLATGAVQGYIREAIEARKKRTHLDQDAVVLEQARIGLSNISEFIKWDGKGIHVTPSEDLSDDALRALEMVEIHETEFGDGVIKRRIKFKLHPKAPALESLAKHLGMYTQKHEVTHKFGVIRVPARVEPKDWIETVSHELEYTNGSSSDN